MLLDFKSKKHEQYAIAFSIDETIEKIAIADAGKRKFIFEIKEYNRHSQDAYDFSKTLQLIDLSEKKIDVIKTLPKKAGSTWATAHGKIFLWYFDEKIIQVYDMNLEPSQHPLGDLIKQNKNKIDFTRMIPHPILPFAILWGGEKDDSYISWGEGKPKTPQPLPTNGSYFSFSPDGKWVTFRRGFSNEGNTYLMPVSEKYPNYLGTPILLGRYFNERKFAWTTNPTGFVGSSLDKLYRWELSNEAYPESDKPTFHEYIVEKDLERMAKEKKQ